MNRATRSMATFAVALITASCASTGPLVTPPGVSLRNIEAVDIGFSSQTFQLGFDVTNPNPFALPISSVAYNVELDGYRFATGRTVSNFTIPSSGDGEFVIAVELDLLKTAPQLLYTVRDATRRPIPYELNGRFGLDIPLVPPVEFRTSGFVRLQEIGQQALQRP